MGREGQRTESSQGQHAPCSAMPTAARKKLAAGNPGDPGSEKAPVESVVSCRAAARATQRTSEKDIEETLEVGGGEELGAADAPESRSGHLVHLFRHCKARERGSVK